MLCMYVDGVLRLLRQRRNSINVVCLSLTSSIPGRIGDLWMVEQGLRGGSESPP
ncbi:hypothetical protein BDZ91DRAFT_734202 [Kalaharituber pfeilii]|nr:hypothetical protein BDZ91DRAFT_734202 [Kalaharituber pfeilii]